MPSPAPVMGMSPERLKPAQGSVVTLDVRRYVQNRVWSSERRSPLMTDK